MASSRHFLSCLCVIAVAFAITVFGCNEGRPGLPHFKNVHSILHHIDVNTYKEIDCSAENACHVVWYKDGVTFPFGWTDRELQDMGISGSADNQTLILRKAEMRTSGNYTCIVSNQVGSIERHLELRVQGNDWIHAPILAFDNHCNEKTTRIGHNATFNCKFFVGPKEDETIATWYYVDKENPDKSLHKHNLVWIYERELNYTMYDMPMPFFDGKFLHFSLSVFNVTEPALGTYVVQAVNGIGPSARHRMTLSLRQPDEVSVRGRQWNPSRRRPQDRRR